MNQIFILQNQDNLFLGKQKEWLDGRDPGSLFKTPHKDEAINQMFEVSSKDYTQRIKVLGCGVNEKGLPVIDVELLPPPQPKAVKLVADKVAADDSSTPHDTSETLNEEEDFSSSNIIVDDDESEADVSDDENPQNPLI